MAGIVTRLFRALSPKPKTRKLAPPTSLLGRVKQLTRANIEELLGEAQDPEAAANAMLADYEGALQEARGAVSDAITTLRHLEGRQVKDEAEIPTWADRAELAATRARRYQSKNPTEAAAAEKMALTALQRERALTIRVDARRPALEDQQELVERLKHDIQQMEERYSALQEQRDTLLSRARFASAQAAVATVTRATDGEDATSTMHSLERTVREREALAQGHMELASNSVEAQFRALEAETVSTSAEGELDVLMGRKPRSLGKGRS